MFVNCMDKHAPRKLKRISKKRAPWITRGLLHKMHKRDLIKKKAISSNGHVMWEQFKCARNQANNAIKHAKKRYFSDNLEASKGNPRKTWNLINELSSRNTSKSSNILEIQVDNRTISTSGDMAEAFNEHFTNIAQVLAQEVPVAEVIPEFYLSYTDKAFCLNTPSLDVVFNLLRKIDEKKATGLDMIPSKLLKMAVSIVAPSLTAIFTKSILTGIYPTEWKTARVTPVFKKGVKSDLNNYRPISVIPVVSKVAKLKWEKLSLRRKKQKALIMYKTLNELAPEYLQCLFTQRHVNDYNLRNLEGKLSLPKPNTNYLKRSFCYSGACLWNNLPQDLKSVGSIGQFKRGIKKISEISDSHTAIM